MIKSWEEHQLNMDYSHIGVVCSDIDLIHITPKGFLILGEIKNHHGTFKHGQKTLLSSIIDNNSYGGTVLYITHDSDVHKGDSIVDISQCLVEEYYWKGEWVTPYRFITVKEAMKILEEK